MIGRRRSHLFRLLRSGELKRSPGGTITFVGEDHGSGVSFFLVSGDPGAGPPLHTHPYSETWIVQGGAGRFTVEAEEVDVGPGDIVVVGAETPHKFTNVGSDRLELVCIHASPRMIQVNLE